MRQTMHIFMKDVRHLWPAILVVFALTAALSALRIEIPCHVGIPLNASLFRGTAAIVRHRRHIRNTGDFKTHGI